MSDHDANLARVQALRERLKSVAALLALIHVEDVLTRHPEGDEDYTSALTLLDALDGGGHA